MAQWVRSLDLTAHTSLSPIRHGFAPSFVNYKKGCTRLAAASDKVYQLLDQGRWFSPGTPASSTTKTGRHDIAEILLKVALKHKKSINTLDKWAVELCNRKWNVDINVFIFSIIFFTYINLESVQNQLLSFIIYRSVQISVILSILKIKKKSSEIILWARTLAISINIY